MTTKRHVRGKRAVGGGKWYFKLCGGIATKCKSSVYVAPTYTNCKKCQKICDRIYGSIAYEEPTPNEKGILGDEKKKEVQTPNRCSI